MLTLNYLNKQIDTTIKLRVEEFKKKEIKEGTYRFLADGDSWFDYPLPLGFPSDVINQLPNLFNNKPDILNLSHHGDTSIIEVGVKRTLKIIDAIHECKGNFNAILFSGGGNDVAGDQFQIWLNEASTVENDDSRGLNIRFDNILNVIKASYEDLIDLRDKYLPGKTIFTHGYDFPVPTGIGVCGMGPWLKPSLNYKGWMDYDAGFRIVRNALMKMSTLMMELSSDPKNNLIYVQTQGTLERTEWANELHPNVEGFKKIALKFKDALQKKFPDLN